MVPLLQYSQLRLLLQVILHLNQLEFQMNTLSGVFRVAAHIFTHCFYTEIIFIMLTGTGLLSAMIQLRGKSSTMQNWGLPKALSPHLLLPMANYTLSTNKEQSTLSEMVLHLNNLQRYQ